MQPATRSCFSATILSFLAFGLRRLNGGDPCTPPSSVARGGPFAPLRSLARLLELFIVLLFVGSWPSSADAATLRGSVVDPDSRVVPSARIAITSPLIGSRDTRADANGTFRFDDLPAGSYDIVALVDGFRADPLRVRLFEDRDDRTVTVRLRISALTESIVVTAAQIDRPVSRTAESLDVMTAEDLSARQLESVADALRLVPGLAVTGNGGRGALTSIFPRGGESDFTLVLVDGFPVNLFGGGFDVSQLAAGDIERIEVVRGPQSALFGADAIGSVVQVITKEGAGPLLESLIEGGSFGTSRLVARTGGSHRRWSWGLGGERFGSEGYGGRAPATGEVVSNDDSLMKHASAGLGWAGRAGEVRARARWTSTDRGFPGPFGSDPLRFYSGVDHIARGASEGRLLSLTASRAWGTKLRTRVQAGHFKQHGHFLSQFGASTSDTRRSTIRSQADVVGHGGFDFSAGIEVRHEQAGNTFITGERFQAVPVDRRTIGSFGEARYALGERLFVTAGLRVEHIRRDRLEADPNPFSPRPAFDADLLTSVNPKISAAFFVAPPVEATWTKLRFGAGTGIRPPDAFEIAFTDNPSLKPERSRSIEAGVEQAFLAGRVTVEATGFFNRYDDLIVAVGRSLRDASRFRTDNISNARSRGIEIAGAWRSRMGLEVRTAYTWLDTEILAVDRTGSAPPPFRPGDPLVRRPRHQGHIDAMFVRSRLVAFARLKARGSVLDVEPSFGASGGLFPAPGFGVIDVGGSVRLWPRLVLFGRAGNVTDRFYEEALGFPGLGRSLAIGIRVATAR